MDLNEFMVLDLALLVRTAKHENDGMKLQSDIFEAEYQRSLEDKAQSACKDLLALLANAPAKAAEPFRKELENRGLTPDVARRVIFTLSDSLETVERPLVHGQTKSRGKPQTPLAKAILEVWPYLKANGKPICEASRMIATAMDPRANRKKAEAIRNIIQRKKTP